MSSTKETKILQDLEEIAAALSRVLGDEYQALRRLDASGVERSAVHKEVLTEKLVALKKALPDHPEVRTTLERIRSASQVNQALLVHARACLRGALELAAGVPRESPSYARPQSGSTPRAVRMDIRG